MNRKQRRADKTRAPAEGLVAEAQGHHRSGNIDQAIAGYRAVIAVAPNHVDAIMNLANLLTQRGFRDEAAVRIL